MPGKRKDQKAEHLLYRAYETLERDTTFTIGQVYEDDAAATLRCSTCHGTDFKVGQGSYFTAISCSKCGWERCIHEG